MYFIPALLAFFVLDGGALIVASSHTVSLRQTVLIDEGQWTSLNNSVNGRLYAGTPFALPCFSDFNNEIVSPNETGCSIIQAEYLSAIFRSTYYSASMNPQWETCQANNQQCLLDASDPYDPLAFQGTTCYQGSVAEYYIEVQEASDVQAAYNFSTATKIPLSIKNSGHEYKGRSYQPGSLALWTRNLRKLIHNNTFVAEGCTTSYNAMTIGAGNNFQEVYDFANENNVTFIGGYAQTVGTGGGWVMGGGHSVLSPVFGLGVDRVLEFKIVTPDGQLRVANECQNSDLFWALRGGGGGTFGVVLESTHKVEDQLTLQVASIAFNATATNLRSFYEILVNNSLEWSTQGWGGHISGSSLIFVTPNLSLDEATESMQSVTDYAISQNGTSTIETLSSWYSFFENYVIYAEAPVGQLSTTASRLIPKANFAAEEGRTQLVDLLLSLPVVLASVVTPVLFNETANATSVTPAWRDSLWHLLSGAQWPYNYTVAQTQATYEYVHNLTLQMTAIAPDSGAYFSEGDVYEADYETSYWGPNYPALLAIKNKYDPYGLLDCWQCVGSANSSADQFQCYIPLPGTASGV